jgi:predicted TIM-barrel fold metal-dependent hydrolase
MLIDVHGHIGRIVPDRKEFIDAANIIAKMDAWGIDKTFVLPLSEHPEGAYMECNTDEVIAACSRYPERLIPFCLIDPRFGNRTDMDFSYLLEEYIARGCKGLGEFLPKMDFDHPLCLNLYHQAGKYNLPVIFDMQDRPEGYGVRDDYGLPKLEHALAECPETVFVGHGPTFWAEISSNVPVNQRSGYPKGAVEPGGAVPRLMRKYSNLWAEMSAGSGYNAVSRDISFSLEFFDEFQDKLMFGTDSCLRSDAGRMSPNVAFIREMREAKKLSDNILDKVEWKNCVSLFGLDGIMR